MSTPPRKKRPADLNQLAYQVFQEAIGEAAVEPDQFQAASPTDEGPTKNLHATELGKLGARKGGLKRAATLTPEQRKEIARNAALKRWGKQKSDKS